jgi:hypothetical protein
MYNWVEAGPLSGRTPVAGAYDNGIAGSGGTDGFTTLSGYSDEEGILDSPGVSLNVNWLFTWDYETEIPPCGSFSKTLYQATPGSYASGTCEEYYD